MRPVLAENLLRGADAGAADGTVQAAERLDRRLDSGADRRLVGDVGRYEVRVHPELIGKLLAFIPLDVGDHDVAALCRQHAGARVPQTRARAADQKCLLVDLHR